MLLECKFFLLLSSAILQRKNVSASFVFFGLEMIKGFIPNRVYNSTFRLPAVVG